MMLTLPVVLMWAVAAAQAGTELPLVASHLVTGPSSHVELTNRGSQPITAWSLAVVTQRGAGGTHREVETADGYLSEVTHGLPGSSDRFDRLMPGQTRQIALDSVPEGAKVEVVAVVLEDRTAFGDPEVVKAIFDHRAAERDELRKVVDILNDVLKAKQGVAALEELKARLGAPSPDQSTPHRAACEAVQTYLQRAAGSNAEEADRSIRTYAAFVQREHDLAMKHSR
jgi:hypothetical protein